MVNEFYNLKYFSAIIGNDKSLIQGAGGNTSIKIGENLFIKASGKRLSDALNNDIFVKIKINSLLNHNEFNTKNFLKNLKNLRPSIEAKFHAIIPKKIVIHTHPIEINSITIRNNSQEILNNKLKKFNWKFIEYATPGEKLFKVISESLLESNYDVFVMANHGLIIAAETTVDAKNKQNEVIDLCRQKKRMNHNINLNKLQDIISIYTDFKLPQNELIHTLATDSWSLELASRNPPYPDHILFCGKTPKIIEERKLKEELNNVRNYCLIPGLGVIIRRNISKIIEEMLLSQAEIYLRIPINNKVNVLNDIQCREILNSENEKFRKIINLN